MVDVRRLLPGLETWGAGVLWRGASNLLYVLSKREGERKRFGRERETCGLELAAWVWPIFFVQSLNGLGYMRNLWTSCWDLWASCGTCGLHVGLSWEGPFQGNFRWAAMCKRLASC